MLHNTPPVLRVATSEAPAQCSALLTAGKRHVRLAYKPYFFSQRIIFFSHNKSANSTFSHDLSAKRTGQKAICHITRPPGTSAVHHTTTASNHKVLSRIQEHLNQATSQPQNIRNDQATFNKFTNHIVTTTRKHPVQ